MRRQNAQMLALFELQGGMCFYPGGEEEEPPEGVRLLNRPMGCSLCPEYRTDILFKSSAKYIEGLENRLGRMESLLRLSGLLSEDDGGKTDLGTLEKRLADRSLANGLNPAKNAQRFSVPNIAQQATASQSTPHADSQSSPRTVDTSPAPQKDSETEVENLSDMMCALVTNNCGETRYIGRLLVGFFE